MTFVRARAPRLAERGQRGRGHAGLFGFAERQADVEHPEAADGRRGPRRQQRTFQATDGHREVGAERRSCGVVAQAAGQVDRDAQSAERV
jgi:hypothetical protein